MSTPSHSVANISTCCGRRTVLKAAGLVALSGSVGALGACGATSWTTSTDSDATSVPVSKVPVGGGVILGKYVVTQPTDGVFRAFSAVCPHQGCPVGSVADGEVVCPCHNSHFDIADGAPVSGPAQRPLTSAKFTRSDHDIIITT
ncbi:MAG: Rieske (2Fe-2S) protein [Microlunatus sp.]|nr:Rieske (2Fe-2S) protein [Microlunatus sp.]